MNSSLSQGVLPRRAKSGSRRAVTSSSSRTAQSYGGRSTAFRSCHSSSSGRRRGAVVGDAFGTCTRVACAAVIALVLLGDNSSARSSLPSDRRTAASGHHRQHHHMAWQLFAPKARSSPSERAAASLNLKRRTRLAGADSVSAVSPAQMYRVTEGSSSGRGRGQRRQHEQRFSRDDSGGREDGRSSIEALQSPRSAELLTAYASASSAAAAAPQPPSQQRPPSIAECIGGGVVTQGEGRPALPLLDDEDLTQLRAGQRVQKQTRQGGSGSGSVVVDVRADPDVVLGLLTKYEDYAEMIDTVRECEVFPQGETADSRKVGVMVSRFKLHIRVVMSLLRERNMVQFELDPDCTKAGRAVLREATGFFYVESPPDRPGFSRVWMLAKVDVNRFVPGAIVDYAAGRALPRASNWIKPTCEAAQRRKLRAATA
ncbi:conserved unknown protein [Ectocarpus siliculosus]|uniref:Coenzyme Q-binding protein COQ10 START domain-containing protein n=1 Tax=Ectocarpus siliculosus TaxID=2880 RepID=D7FJT4_ECTSI|nr:conserved unknown protein [Ectocarpus siliculosus]|eukprot:CBJ29186.1 conserved unknown protein [Ectocarpus siliculosus]